MNDDLTEYDVAVADDAAMTDAQTPLAFVPPIELVEVDEPGESPPEDWYERVAQQTLAGEHGGQ